MNLLLYYQVSLADNDRRDSYFWKTVCMDLQPLSTHLIISCADVSPLLDSKLLEDRGHGLILSFSLRTVLSRPGFR